MKFDKAVSSDQITPASVFFDRRRFMKLAGSALLMGGAPSVGAEDETTPDPLTIPFERPDVFPTERNQTYVLPKQAAKRPLTPREVAATHNNFYEFMPGMGGPVYKYVGDFPVDPWKVTVTGLCRNPMTLDLDDLFGFPHEERLYHFRCVERWAMNVPWSGFPLAELIKKADPTPKARYVRFVSAADRKHMPGIQKAAHYDWPYVEALRLDEATNELAMAVTGVYGKPLPVQHGAPIRIIVPWKYGYKNPKSVVRIEFTARKPQTFWKAQQPHEYGFLSNVNPYIPHPRWSQKRSVWLGRGNDWFPTEIFNGYESFVGHLYPDEPRKMQRALRPGQQAR